MRSVIPLLAVLGWAGAALAADNGLYAIYASGDYAGAEQAGMSAHSADGYAIAARAAMAEAVLKPSPCLECLKKAEAFARQAVAADPRDADGQIWLAVALGYEARITGIVKARLADAPEQSKAALDAAMQSDPKNPFALSGMGGWNIEIVKGGGSLMARMLYGASESKALQLFDDAAHLAPDNVAVRYQIGLSLAGFDPDKYRARIRSEWTAAIHDTPESAYEKAMQERASRLLAALAKDDSHAFAALVRQYQGYPP
jgi:hypothetical protein